MIQANISASILQDYPHNLKNFQIGLHFLVDAL